MLRVWVYSQYFLILSISYLVCGCSHGELRYDIYPCCWGKSQTNRSVYCVEFSFFDMDILDSVQSLRKHIVNAASWKFEGTFDNYVHPQFISTKVHL